jgi:hypothetical protein
MRPRVIASQAVCRPSEVAERRPTPTEDDRKRAGQAWSGCFSGHLSSAEVGVTGGARSGPRPQTSVPPTIVCGTGCSRLRC